MAGIGLSLEGPGFANVFDRDDGGRVLPRDCDKIVPRGVIVPRPRGVVPVVPRAVATLLPLAVLAPRVPDPAAAVLAPRVVPLVFALPLTAPPRGNIAYQVVAV